MGDLSLTKNGERVSTLLGSCIAVTMLHRPSGMAAMCHCLLATVPRTERFSKAAASFTYMEQAIPEMVSYFQRAGIATSEIEVKVFGGADVMEVLACGGRSVGANNVEFIQRQLADYGLSLAASDLRGTAGRKIIFETATGAVLVRRFQVERHARPSITEHAKPGHGIAKHTSGKHIPNEMCA